MFFNISGFSMIAGGLFGYFAMTTSEVELVNQKNKLVIPPNKVINYEKLQ